MQAAGGTRLSEPPRLTDVRVGSTTRRAVPVSVATRSLAAGPYQWAAMLVVALAAVAADQVTKAVVRSRLDLYEAVDVTSWFQIHHVRNTGIAFGLFPARPRR